MVNLLCLSFLLLISCTPTNFLLLIPEISAARMQIYVLYLQTFQCDIRYEKVFHCIVNVYLHNLTRVI